MSAHAGCAGGIHVTDVSNAARTFLMDIRTLAWDAELLQRFGLSQDMLPRICSNAEVYGAVKGTPLDGIPIAGWPWMTFVRLKKPSWILARRISHVTGVLGQVLQLEQASEDLSTEKPLACRHNQDIKKGFDSHALTL